MKHSCKRKERCSVKFIQNAVLRLIAWLYGKITEIRNHLFDTSKLPQVNLPVPVVSVGNLSVGGTGKTPFVISLAQVFQNEGFRVGIITRGYGRISKNQVLVSQGNGPLVTALESGDEPYLIAIKTRQVVIISDADRVAAARRAIQVFDCNLILADDGFQHRHLARNLDIVLWDAYDNPVTARLLPLGRMRESWESLKRADLLIITRCESIPEHFHSFFRSWQPDLSLFQLDPLVKRLWNPVMDTTFNQELLVEQRLFVFCALGNPTQFFDTVQHFSPKKMVTRAFRDHHKYTATEIRQLVTEAKLNSCNFILTTAKDYYNFPMPAPELDNLIIVDIEIAISENLWQEIQQRLSPTDDSASDSFTQQLQLPFA
jgi:tetraacyldisaccharide 4'-kinase